MARSLVICAAIAFASALPRTAVAQAAQDLPLSAQLYTARDVGTLEQQFAVIAKAGFRYVEMFRFYGMAEVPAAKVKGLLDKHGLKVSGYHVAFSELIDNLKPTIEYSKALGNTRLIIPAFSATVTPTTQRRLGGAWQSRCA